MPYTGEDKDEKRRAAQKRHYEKNKQYYIDKARERKRRLYKWYRALKATLKCIKCGEDHAACLSFHHRDRKKKLKAVYEMVNLGYSETRILEEMAKCDVLCENCHRKLEWKLQYSKNAG